MSNNYTDISEARFNLIEVIKLLDLFKQLCTDKCKKFLNTQSLNNENGDKCLYNCFSKVVEGNTKALASIDSKYVLETAKQFI